MPELILIVDDEKDLVTTLKYNLGKEGFQIRTALTGKSALEQVWLKPLPDLVLLDLMLPDMTGTEVCRRIREDARSRAIPDHPCLTKRNPVGRLYIQAM